MLVSFFERLSEYAPTIMPARHRSILWSKPSVKNVSGARKGLGWACSVGFTPRRKACPRSRIRISPHSSSHQVSQSVAFTSWLGRLLSNGLPSSRSKASDSGVPRTLKRLFFVDFDKHIEVKATLLPLISDISQLRI